MEVKTESGNVFDAAGNGTKGIAIGGLVTGVAALIGGGLLGMFGNNRCNNNYGNNCYGNNNYGYNNHGYWPHFVEENEFHAQKEISNLSSILASERAERYTDLAVIQSNKDKYEFNRSIANAIVEDRQRLASLEQYNCSQKEISNLKEELMNQKLCNLENKIHNGLAIESERRVNGDSNVFNYCKATYVPGQLIMPASSICPECMPRYNSYTTPTTTATTPTA